MHPTAYFEVWFSHPRLELVTPAHWSDIVLGSLPGAPAMTVHETYPSLSESTPVQEGLPWTFRPRLDANSEAAFSGGTVFRRQDARKRTETDRINCAFMRYGTESEEGSTGADPKAFQMTLAS